MEKDDIKLILSSLRQKTKSLLVNIGIWLWRWSRWGGGLPIASLIIIGLGLFVFLKLEVIDFPNIYYLLSAISQGLAVILAIILSAILIAGQLASRYSPELLKEAFKHPTLFYVALLIVSVALPLAILANTDVAFSVMWVKFSLALAGACLTFLIPYFLYIKEQFDPKKLIDNLYNECLRNYRKGRPMKKDDIIQETVLSLYNTKSYGGFEHGLQKLTQLVKDAAPLPAKPEEGDEEELTKRVPRVVPKLINILRQIGISVEDNPTAIRMVVKQLGDCFLSVRTLQINDEIKEGLVDGITEMIECGRQAPCTQLAFMLGGIGGSAAKEAPIPITKRLLEVLREMFSMVLVQPWDKAAKQVIRATYWVGKKAVEEVDIGGKDISVISEEAIKRLWGMYKEAVGEQKFSIANEASYRISSLGWIVANKGLEGPANEAILRHGEIVKKTISLSMKKESEEVLNELIRIGAKLVHTLPEVTISSLRWLTTIGSLVYKDNESLAQRVIEGIGTIGEKATVQAKPEVVKEVANSLSSLAEKINSGKPQLASLIAAQLWKLGRYAIELLPEEQALIKNTLNSLKSRVGEKALETGFKEVEQFAASPELFEFKEYYETDC